MAEEHITQVSEEIEGRVSKKLSQEFSRTESRILCALSKIDEFLLNPQVRTRSVAVPWISWNNKSENREPTGDRFLGDPCPEAIFSACHSSNLNDSEQGETYHSYIFYNLVMKKFQIQSRPLVILVGQLASKRKKNPSRWVDDFPSILQIWVENDNFSYERVPVGTRS